MCVCIPKSDDITERNACLFVSLWGIDTQTGRRLMKKSGGAKFPTWKITTDPPVDGGDGALSSLRCLLSTYLA